MDERRGDPGDDRRRNRRHARRYPRVAARSGGSTRSTRRDWSTWIAGRAGVLASEEYGTGLVATDVIERIPAAIRQGA